MCIDHLCLLIGAYWKLGSYPPIETEDKTLSFLKITFQRDASQVLEQDFPGL